MCLYGILLLLFAARAEQHPTSVTIREGDEAVLNCASLKAQDKCLQTTWDFSHRTGTEPKVLVTFGQNNKSHISKAIADWMSVAVNCSLLIQSVTAKDVGSYTCKQPSSNGQEQAQHVQLSVVSISEHEDSDWMKLSCVVSTHSQCTHHVQWLYNNQPIEGNPDLEVITSNCSANVTFSTSHYVKENMKLLKCEVTDGSDNRQQFTFRSPASGKRKLPFGGDDARGEPSSGSWWLYIVVAVGVAALLVAALLLIRWRKTTGKKQQMDKSMTDPEESISYSSIMHTKNSSNITQVRGCDHAVTYSTVRVGASTDPSSVYAVVD